jgi:tetratricopeptide (TPR) repeat protein
VSACFSLAVVIEPRLAYAKVYQRHDKSAIEVILGEARRLFATHFYTKADVYFHSGFYPSIFDEATERDAHMATDAGAVQEKHEHDANFLGQPLDWIDRFSRAFFPSSHTHLDAGGARAVEKHDGHGREEDHDLGESGDVREILPWLKITADLDPNRIETYTVGAYWLRTRMNKPKEAEEFLRQGLKANPGNYAILFELGRIYFESYKDLPRARNVWEAALQRWNQQEASKKPDTFLRLQITSNLALLEEQTGNKQKAINYLEMAKNVSPHPEAVQKRIDELNTR